MAEQFCFWATCDGCGVGPVQGDAYRCLTCAAGPDTDLCASCYDAGDTRHHDAGHEFDSLPSQPVPDTWAALVAAAAAAPLTPPAPAALPWLVRVHVRAPPHECFAGHGVIVRSADPLAARLYTALHCLAPLRAPGAPLPVLAAVAVFDLLRDPPRWPAHEIPPAECAVTPAPAHVCRAADWLRWDCRVRACRHPPTPLAGGPPAPGQTLFVCHSGGVSACAVLHAGPATATLYRPPHSAPIVPLCSGSPVVDAAGHVHGVLSEAGRLPGGAEVYLIALIE